MKIAVTYDNGTVFQHFGKTETFKIFEIVDSQIISSEMVDSDNIGHSALAGLLLNNKVNVLICGGIGEGAKSALSDAGIEIFAGVEGPVDSAVEAFLNGDLVSFEGTCNHHDEEESHDCGSQGCGGSCGSSCGGCGGSCGITGPNVGKTCRVHYRGTFNDGTQFDSSYDRGETLDFVCGAGMMIRGFDAAVANMEVGQTINIHLMPEEAYGVSDPNAFITMEISQLPGSEKLEAGQRVYLYNSLGQPVLVTVTAKDESIITFDTNHEMAGKELNFQIELVEAE